MGSMSQEELISWLYQLIDHELDKPEEETDNALIAECSRYLDELQAGDLEMSDTEILARLEQIKKYGAIKKKTRHRFVKVFIPIAATFIMLFLTLSVAASINGTTLGQFISDNLQKISRMAKGETIEEGKITVIKTAGRETYGSVEDFLGKEHLNVLFPQPLPEEIALEHIQVYDLEEDQHTIAFIFQKDHLQIIVRKASSTSTGKENYFDVWDEGITPFYIYDLDSQYLASGEYNGYEYTVESTNLNFLKEIIKNMKEFET